MATEIKWSERAVSHLQHIYNYISFDSAYYAERFVKSLVKAAESQLSQFPLIGRNVPEFAGTSLEFLREIIFRGYRIIYNPQSVPERITIIAIMNAKMNIPTHLKQDWITE